MQTLTTRKNDAPATFDHTQPGPPQCEHHAPESWWPNDKRCSKTAEHRGAHLAYHQGLGGRDERCFRIWRDGDTASTYYEHLDVGRERLLARKSR